MLVFAGIASIYLIFSYKYPDFMFWLALTIFLDPGGYIFTYISRSLIGGFQITDLNFILLLLPLTSPKVNIKSYFRTKDNHWIFYFMLFYTIIYQGFVYGYVSTGASFSDLLNNLQYQRLTMFGFIVIIPAYVFFRRNYMLLVKFAFATSLVLVFLYIIRITSGLKVLPFWTHERGLGISAMRMSMYSYGFAYWFIYISLVIYLFRLHIQRKNWIYFIGIIIVIAVILTLTRRSILLLIYATLLIYLLRQRLYNQSIISLKMSRILVAFGLTLFVLFLFAPSYINHTKTLIENAFTVVSADDDFELSDGRLENDIPKHIARFKQSPIIGYGYDKLWYSNKSDEGGLSANDVPLTASLGMFGILGISLFAIFYIRIIKILRNCYRILKGYIYYRLEQHNAILFIILAILLVSFITKFTINFMSLFTELITGKERVSSFINIGFLLAARDILKFRVHKFQLK